MPGAPSNPSEPTAPPGAVAEDWLRGFRDRQIAAIVCSTLHLVGVTEPAMLADALSQVFDVRAAEAAARATLANVQKMREQAAVVVREFFAMRNEVAELKKAIERDLDKISVDIDALHRRLDRAGVIVAKILNKEK